MRTLKLAIDQMAPRLGDVEANFQEHREAIRWAKKQQAELLVFPELSLTGYNVLGMVPEVAMAPEDGRLAELSSYAGKLGVILGLVERAPDGQFYNSAFYLKDGAVRAIQRKIFLPEYGMFDEKRFFAAGEHIAPFDTPWGRIGILICFDMLHPVAAYLHEVAGARILIVLSASPARGIGPDGEMAAAELFRTAQRAHSRLSGLVTVFVNRVGSEEGLTFWGGSAVLDAFAHPIAVLPEYDASRAICEIDLDSITRARTMFPHLKEGRPDFVLQELWRIRMGHKDRFPPPEFAPDTDMPA